MTQLEPLVYTLLLQNNDERLIDGILKNETNSKFTFETNNFNESLVKLMYCCCTEKFEKESDEAIKKKLGKKKALLDNLISKEDFYLENLNSFLSCSKYTFTLENFKKMLNEDYSKFISHDMINYITNLREDIWNLREHYLNQKKLTKFYEETCKVLESCAERIKKEFKHDSGQIFYQQIIIYKLGLYGSIISFWSLLKTVPFLNKSLTSEGFYLKIVSLIAKLLSIITTDNPFLIALNFNKNVLNLYFDKDVKSNVNENFLTLYIENMKTMIKYNYKLELVALVDRIVPAIFNRVNFIDKLVGKINESYI